MGLIEVGNHYTSGEGKRVKIIRRAMFGDERWEFEGDQGHYYDRHGRYFNDAKDGEADPYKSLIDVEIPEEVYG